VEPGLLAYLLDIEKPEQISRDPLMGSIFENLVVVEAIKARYNLGLTANLYFYRDSHGNEIDLLHKSGSRMLGMEIKAAETWHPGLKTALNRFSEKTHPLQGKYVSYRGRSLRFEDGVEALPYNDTGALFS
jgi:predicted AAA+ superfamily ATPase